MISGQWWSYSIVIVTTSKIAYRYLTIPGFIYIIYHTDLPTDLPNHTRIPNE